jgi:hypothetical protein
MVVLSPHLLIVDPPDPIWMASLVAEMMLVFRIEVLALDETMPAIYAALAAVTVDPDDAPVTTFVFAIAANAPVSRMMWYKPPA